MNTIHTICTIIKCLYRWCGIFILFFTISCSHEHELYSYGIKDRTLILYLSSDNNLNSIANNLFNSISTGITPKNSNLLILIDRGSTPTLYYLDKHEFKMIKEFRGMTSIDPKCISQVLSLSKNRFPAIETGLVLWSHGSSWLPSSFKNRTFRSFGYTKGSECDIRELSKSLGYHYDYIIFDACLMGSIEVYSEFSDKANFILGSPRIIPSSGIISIPSIDTLINNDNPIERRLKIVCDLYIKAHSPIKKEISFVSTIQLISFQKYLKSLIESDRYQKTSCPQIKDTYTIRGDIHLYNLEECITKMFPSDKNHILDSMSSFIKYSRSTSSDKYAISVFVPYQKTENYIDYYRTLSWYKSTNWTSIFSSSE